MVMYPIFLYAINIQYITTIFAFDNQLPFRGIKKRIKVMVGRILK